jgi:hypothetical protein
MQSWIPIPVRGVLCFDLPLLRLKGFTFQLPLLQELSKDV